MKTFGPAIPSCRAANTRSNFCSAIRGSCTATARTLSLRSDAATRAPPPPQAITNPGKGGATTSGATACSRRKNPALRNTRTSGTNPAASANPIAWFFNPARSLQIIRAVPMAGPLRRENRRVKEYR